MNPASLITACSWPSLVSLLRKDQVNHLRNFADLVEPVSGTLLSLSVVVIVAPLPSRSSPAVSLSLFAPAFSMGRFRFLLISFMALINTSRGSVLLSIGGLLSVFWSLSLVSEILIAP